MEEQAIRSSEVLTFKEAAARLGVYHYTVSDLVRHLGIEPKPVPRNGNAKGLDAADLKRIRRALGMSRKAEPQPAA